MKQRKHALFLIALFLAIPSITFAIGETATIQSVLYIATAGNRHATQEIDAAFFNPAGLAFIEQDRFYYMAGNGCMFQTKRIKDASQPGGKEYEGDVQALVIPALAGAVRIDNIAVFLHMGPYGGIGTGEFKEGTPESLGMSIKIQPMILGATLGVAYAVTDILSVAFGAKYFYGKKTVELSDNSSDFKSVATGTGYGITLGLDAKPQEKINIGFQFMWNSELELENKTETSEGGFPTMAGETYFPDGGKSKAQLPMLATLGVSYEITPALKAEVDGLLYFEWLNDLGKVEADPLAQSKDAAGDDISEHYGPGFEVGIGLEYAAMPDTLKIHMGYMFGKQGQKQEIADEFSYYPDYNQVGIGATIHIMDELELSMGYLIVMMISGKKSWHENQEFNDGPAHLFGIGLQGRISL